MILEVPYVQQSGDIDCVPAVVSMATSRPKVDILRYNPMQMANGNSLSYVAQALSGINEREGTSYRATFFFDPVEDAHAAVLKGKWHGNRVLTKESPREFVARTPGTELIPALKASGERLLRETHYEKSPFGSELRPVIHDPGLGGYSSRVSGSKMGAMNLYLSELSGMQRIVDMGHDVKFYRPAMGNSLDENGGACKDVPIESLLPRGPVAASVVVEDRTGKDRAHCVLIVGKEDNRLVVHDPARNGGPNLKRDTVVHDNFANLNSALVLIES